MQGGRRQRCRARQRAVAYCDLFRRTRRRGRHHAKAGLPARWPSAEPGDCSAGQPGLQDQASAGLILRAGSEVGGRANRSARHHSRSARKCPRGVPPSPSRLFALTPPRPSATGRYQGPARIRPCEGRPGSTLTRMVPRETCRMAHSAHKEGRFPRCRLRLYPRMFYFAPAEAAKFQVAAGSWGSCRTRARSSLWTTMSSCATR
jgi:hypothetical protein